VPSQKFAALATAEDEHFKAFRLGHLQLPVAHFAVFRQSAGYHRSPRAGAARQFLEGLCRGRGEDIGLAVEGRDQTVDAVVPEDGGEF
jgi:hypothetical protein